MTAAYFHRHFDAQGTLLYVTVEEIADRKTALEGERKAILAEALFNILGNPRESEASGLPRTYPHLTFRLSESLMARIDAAAIAGDRPVSSILIECINSHLPAIEAKLQISPRP